MSPVIAATTSGASAARVVGARGAQPDLGQAQVRRLPALQLLAQQGAARGLEPQLEEARRGASGPPRGRRASTAATARAHSATRARAAPGPAPAARAARSPRARPAAASAGAAPPSSRSSRWWPTAARPPRSATARWVTASGAVRADDRAAWRAGSPRAAPLALLVHLFRHMRYKCTRVRSALRPTRHHLRGPLPRWERGNWRATEIDFSEDARAVARGLHRLRAQGRALELRALLLGRGRGGRRPLALHRRRAARGAEVLPRHPAGRRGAPRRLLQPLHAARSRASAATTSPTASTAIKPQLTWGFRKVFDRLETMSDELRRDPSIPKLAAAVTLYHVVIEATLAQPGQHFITSYLERPRPAARLPRGHGERRRRRAAPHRLRREAAGRPLRDGPRGAARRRRPAARGDPLHGRGARPAGLGHALHRVFGFTLEDIGEEGATSLETKLRSAGLPIDELPGPPVFPPGTRAEERAERGQKLVQGGVLGEKLGPPPQRPRDDGGALRARRRRPRHREAPSEPGHDPVGVRRRRALARGGRQRRHARRRRAAPRRPRSRSSAATRTWWTSSAAARTRLRLAARGRLRPRGDLRWLWRARGCSRGSASAAGAGTRPAAVARSRA